MGLSDALLQEVQVTCLVGAGSNNLLSDVQFELVGWLALKFIELDLDIFYENLQVT